MSRIFSINPLMFILNYNKEQDFGYEKRCK